MPVEVIANIRGLRGSEKALIELGQTYTNPKYAVQAIRPAIRAALKPLVSAIASLTPVDTGVLRDSVKLRIKNPTKTQKSNPGIGKDAVLIGEVGWQWRKGFSLGRQALAVEFGTKNHSATPVLRPTLENNVTGIISAFSKALKVSIEKKARMLAKKHKTRR